MRVDLAEHFAKARAAWGGKPLFHGNVVDLGPGDRVTSAFVRGEPGNFPNITGPRPKVAWATENENQAWHFADRAQQEAFARKEGHIPRTSVAAVDPHAYMEQGVYHGDHPQHQLVGEDLKEWTAPGWNVRERLDIRPGRQGTFPLNWNQFRRPTKDGMPHPVWDDAYNHPSDDDIEYGHEGGKMRQRSHEKAVMEFMPEDPPKPDHGQLPLFETP